MNGLMRRADASCVGRSGLQLRTLLRTGGLGWRDPRVFIVYVGGMLLGLRGSVDAEFVLGASEHHFHRFWGWIGFRGPLCLGVRRF